MTEEEKRLIIDAIPRKYFYPVVHFVQYDENGMVTQIGTAPIGILQDRQAAGHRLVQSLPGQTDVGFYVDLTNPAVPAVAARPTLSVTPNKLAVRADGVDKVTIPNIPNGTKVRLDSEVGAPEQVHGGGTLELAFTEPGRKHVTIDAPGPSKPVTLTIEATE